MKVFARMRELQDNYNTIMPYNQNIGLAINGFHEMGKEVIYYKTGELSDVKQWCNKGDVVLDGIDQVNYILDKFGVHPHLMDYPEPLHKYLGRKIWKDNINSISTHPEKWGCFVKPLREKAFTGKVINNITDLVGCGSSTENYEVYCSDIKDFVFEVRGLVYYNQLVSLQPYRGDWKYMNQLDTKLIEKAFQDYLTWEHKLNGCTLDFGVTKEGETLFIEANYGMCFGPYMSNSIVYAKIISACMAQLTDTVDECYFGALPLS